MPICLRLLVHWARRAASRAAWTAGSKRAIRTAMIAITTRSSIRVKPRRLKPIPLISEKKGNEGERTSTGARRTVRIARDPCEPLLDDPLVTRDTSRPYQVGDV